MISIQRVTLLMVALTAMCGYGCRASDDTIVQEFEVSEQQVGAQVPCDKNCVRESETPKGQDGLQVSHRAGKFVTEEQAIQIAEAEARKRAPVGANNTLKSDATHYDPGEARLEQGGVYPEGGWSVIVWLVPAESAGHWFVFVSDDGRVIEFCGGL